MRVPNLLAILVFDAEADGLHNDRLTRGDAAGLLASFGVLHPLLAVDVDIVRGEALNGFANDLQVEVNMQ